VAAGLLALLLGGVGRAQAQTMDPDPHEPNAQQNAEFRAMAAPLGLAAPPIGWNCTPVMNGDPNGMFWFLMTCEPDSMLIDQQERERREWGQRVLDNARRSRPGRRR
jgi:hypothetical protein